jgi:V8-like Glu-specific endopeptidase
MPARTPTGLHAPVSNQPEVAPDGPDELAAEEPSTGADGAAVEAADDGPEQVEGYPPPGAGYTPEGGLAAEAIWRAPLSEDLRDIAEASFGPAPPMIETVHGPDDRVQITSTSVYPWRAHASLQIIAADGSRWIGTGWFIGPHTLITAGHCVFIRGSNVPGRDGWVRSIAVMPGRNGAALPYGSVTSTNFRSVVGWTNNGDWNYDYGAIILPTQLGSTVGWFGFGVYSDADLLQTTGNISGYPGDKPTGTQWYDARRVASVTNLKVFYDIDTAGGQSGSAVYRITNGGRYAIAVHAYGGATTNSGTRITTPVYNNMVTWKA